MRPRQHPITNPALHTALQRTGWTYAEAADAVRQVAAENAEQLGCDASTIGHWLTGRTPRPDVRPFVVEAFARRLHEPYLTARDLGWPEPPSPIPADPWHGDPADLLAALGADDMLHRRDALAAGAYALAALTLPTTTATATTRTGRTRVGPADAARIRATTAHLGDLDHRFGGGYIRPLIGAVITGHVTPLLHAATGHGRADVFAAAAELAYLAGWANADDRRDAAAQRYYIQAVRLADEAADPVMRASALRSLATQAIELGHARPGLDLADAAADTAKGRCTVRTWAWIEGMQAEAHAAVGEAHAACQALRLAERDVDRADSQTGVAGGYVPASLQHQTGLALADLGDYAGAETHLAASVRTRAPHEHRTRALIGLRLADVQLRRGRPAEAAATVRGLTDDLDLVDCARVTHALADLRTAWQPHRATEPVVAHVDQHIARHP
ncbi:MAG: hypothetical protein HOV68_16850 [Streptomycetaceae bacterium]|nr:hypothetical protein [Streptomycetaceae bacterium]